MNKKRRRTFAEKRAWVLGRLQQQIEQYGRTHFGYMPRPSICATEEEDQQAWQAEFGGREILYTVGPAVSPDFARTLRRMYQNGDLLRVTRGNQEARYNCQKTYCVAYLLKDWKRPSERAMGNGEA